MKSSIIAFIAVIFVSCTSSANSNQPLENNEFITPKKDSYNAVAYFASGCFWCVEAVFESVKGVVEVESGYCGGDEKNPTYEEVSAGSTGHAETVKVYYDTNKVNYQTLLVVFFDSHNPETLNQQGPDRGTQYRSAIFYQNEQEHNLAQAYIDLLLKEKKFSKITTELSAYKEFFIAENYHQNYERNNPNNPYVRAVSVPRINAFKSKHPELLKKE